MDRRTGLIITIGLAVVFGCCGLFSCLWGGMTAAGLGTFEATGLDGVTTAGQTPPAYGAIGICLGLLFIAIPAVAYFFLVRNKPTTPTAM